MRRVNVRVLGLGLWMVAALAVACASGEIDVRDLGAASQSPPALRLNQRAIHDLPLCHTLAEGLRGREATIYLVADSGGLLALALDASIVCVDDADGIIESGIVPVPARGQPVECPFCEGTPLPANSMTSSH